MRFTMDSRCTATCVDWIKGCGVGGGGYCGWQTRCFRRVAGEPNSKGHTVAAELLKAGGGAKLQAVRSQRRALKQRPDGASAACARKTMPLAARMMVHTHTNFRENDTTSLQECDPAAEAEGRDPKKTGNGPSVGALEPKKKLLLRLATGYLARAWSKREVPQQQQRSRRQRQRRRR